MPVVDTVGMQALRCHSLRRSRPVRILCLGDSITAGDPYPGDYPGAWRARLYRMLVSFGAPFELVGTISSGPSWLLQPGHAGVAGDTLAQMGARLPAELAATSPDVVLVLGGTNNVINDGGPPAAMVVAMQAIVDLALPRRVLVGTCAPTVNAAWRTVLADFNNRLMLGAVTGCTVVDVGATVSLPYLIADGIHPGQEAYERMGEFGWFPAVSEALRAELSLTE